MSLIKWLLTFLEIVHSHKMSVTIYLSTQHNISEDMICSNTRWELQISHSLEMWYF